MYERISKDQVSSKLPRETDPKVYNALTDKLANITNESARSELREVKDFLNESKKKLSESDYKLAQDAFKDIENEWNNAYIERKYQEEVMREMRKSGAGVEKFKTRIKNIEKKEQLISSYKNKATRARKLTEWEKEKERLIEEIGEEFNLDAIEASDKYDELLNSIRN